MLRAIAGAALTIGLLVQAPAIRADDLDADEELPEVARDDAEVYITAPGTRIAVDRDQGVVDIRIGDARIYADDSGRLDVRAPGVRIRADFQ